MPEEAETLEVSPPWTWILFLGLGGLLLVFLIWAIFGRVPVTERGRGLLQPVGGARALVATVSGRVGAVRARNGQFVKTGDVILEIEAPSVAGPALVAERDKTLAETDLIRLTANEERTYREQRQRGEDRTRSAQEQLVSLDKSAEMQARKVLASERLYNAELLTTLQVDDAKEAMENIRRAAADPASHRRSQAGKGDAGCPERRSSLAAEAGSGSRAGDRRGAVGGARPVCGGCHCGRGG
ncbi:MAG: biotin/lipoyl-binding protein [Chitinophagaceae bacterium]|nr:biotin/lipoyl-binding protein [Chitinophagaceae bacterium]